MSLSDSMWEGVEAVADVIDSIEWYLSDEATTFDYKDHVTGDLAENIKADLLAVREKMAAYETVGSGGMAAVENVATYGMPGAAEKFIAGRALVEKLTGVTVPNGNDTTRALAPNVVEPGHWQRLADERGIVIAEALAWDPTPEEIDAWEATRSA